MQMTPHPQLSDPPWAPGQVSVPEGGRVWTAAGLVGPRGGRSHLGALSSGCLATSGAGPGSQPTNHLRNGPRAPPAAQAQTRFL